MPGIETIVKEAEKERAEIAVLQAAAQTKKDVPAHDLWKDQMWALRGTIARIVNVLDETYEVNKAGRGEIAPLRDRAVSTLEHIDRLFPNGR